MGMKVYYEGLVDNPELEEMWQKRLRGIAQMDVGPEFWQKLHHAVHSYLETVHEPPKEAGRVIIGFHAQVTNSAITINPKF